MKLRYLIAACLSTAALGSHAVASGAMATVPAPTDPAFQAEVLALHNAERRALGIGDLVWSPDLAKEAEKWASRLAKTGRLEHERQSRHGENLSAATAGRSSVAALVQRWLAEKPNYIPGSAQPNTSKTGNWVDVGHYTAIVWAATSTIGCAVGRGQALDFLVCRYNPPGNVSGYAAYDVRVAARAASAAKPPPPVAPSVPTPVPKPKPASIKA